jgi:hypothetical protein
VLERFGGLGFVLYFLMIGGLSMAVVNVAAHVGESSFQGLTSKKSETSQSSRVKFGLKAQDRAAGWKPAGYVLERPPAPDVSAAALAKGRRKPPASTSDKSRCLAHSTACCGMDEAR